MLSSDEINEDYFESQTGVFNGQKYNSDYYSEVLKNVSFDKITNSYLIPDNLSEEDFAIIENYLMQHKQIGEIQESVTAVQEGAEPMPTLKEGNIIKRKDGRWMGRYYDNGTQKTVYAHSKFDIITKVNHAVQCRDTQEKEAKGTNKKITLCDFIDIWFEEWVQAKSRAKPLSNNTIQNVRYSLFRYIHDSKIANKQLAKLTENDIDKMMDTIPTKSMQARTFGYLKAVFDKAVLKKVIKDTPFKFVEKRVRPARKKKYIPDTKTLHDFLDWLKIEAIDCYYIGKFIIGSGMRIGEVLALTHNDIDFDNKRATVNKAFSQADNAVVDHPKTDAGFRNAPLFDDAIEVLNEIPVSNKTDNIFWMVSKTHISHKFPEKAMKYGLPRLPVHNLRHYYASLCAAMGVDKKTYSRWMGHSDIIQTDEYTHNLSEFEQEQINKMAKKRTKR